VALPTQQELEMLKQARIAAFASVGADGMPHQTAVWFYFDANHNRFYLAVPSNSMKARNVSLNANASILIESRKLYEECGICAQGQARLITDDDVAALRQQVHEKYVTAAGLADAAVGGFFSSFDDAIICLDPARWFSWDMADLDQQMFGGRLQNEGLFHPTEV